MPVPMSIGTPRSGTGSQTAAAGVWFLTCTDGVTDAIAMATL
jgi:hypothetical protein